MTQETTVTPAPAGNDVWNLERQIRRAMWGRHGTPVHVVDRQQVAGALVYLGLRATVHPSDVALFRYRTHDAAEMYAAVMLTQYGHPSLGVIDEPDGHALGLLDLRPAIADHGLLVTDPALPDDPKEPRCLSTA